MHIHKRSAWVVSFLLSIRKWPQCLPKEKAISAHALTQSAYPGSSVEGHTLATQPATPLLHGVPSYVAAVVFKTIPSTSGNEDEVKTTGKLPTMNEDAKKVKYCERRKRPSN